MSQQELIDDKLSLAVLYFKAKDYRKALRLYDGLVRDLTRPTASQLRQLRVASGLVENPVVGKLVHPKLTAVLDQRAATHEKLEDMPSALEDASTIIRYEPISCKGYLRAGKILQRTGRIQQACKTYQEGIYTIRKAREKFKIEISPKLWQSLKAQHTMVREALKSQPGTQQEPVVVEATKPSRLGGIQRQLDLMLPLKRTLSGRPKKSVDPVALLPLDVIEEVFQLLSLRNVLLCHLVSRSWYNTLTRLPSLYLHRIRFRHRVTHPEAAAGLKLIKRIASRQSSKTVRSLKLGSTFNSQHLLKILDAVVGDRHLRLEALDIVNRDFNIEALAGCLGRCQFASPSLEGLRTLRVGINASFRYEAMVLSFKHLRTLEVVVLDTEMSLTNRSMVPLNPIFCDLVTRGNTHENLEVLSLVNHPKLNREFMTVAPDCSTYDPYVPFLLLRVPYLTKLTIVSYDFDDMEADFGHFLLATPHLVLLYLENNLNLSIKSFMMIMAVYQPAFVLHELVLRERRVTKALHLADFDLDQLKALGGLSVLDVYSSSLSIKGLDKLLVLTGASLRSLAIGNCNYIYFRNGRFSTHQKTTLGQVLARAPHLERLSLNELDLDLTLMKFFHDDIVDFGVDRCRLKYLDLSFCPEIDGTGLMNLFSPYRGSVRVDELVVDGIDVSKDTLVALQRRHQIKTFRNDQFRVRWRQYGVNTMVSETR